jgi:thioredoxin reductase (NADPH)
MADSPVSPILVAPSSADRAALMFPTLTPAQIARIAAHGSVRAFGRGEVLIEEGDQVVPFFVVKTGQIEVVRPSGTAETLVALHQPGGFTGEANMLSGRAASSRAR